MSRAKSTCLKGSTFHTYLPASWVLQLLPSCNGGDKIKLLFFVVSESAVGVAAVAAAADSFVVCSFLQLVVMRKYMFNC